MPDDRSAPPEEPSAAPLARPPHLRADAARNRARVLEAAAAQLAAPDGDLAMNSLARTAGVGVGTVYRHFPTRQVLLEALAADGLEALATAAEAVAADGRSAGLAELLRTGLRLQLTDAALVAVLAAPEPACADTRALAERVEAAVEQVLARARGTGDVRDDVGADDARRLLCGLARAVACGPGRLAPSARYVDVLVHGLRPDTDDPQRTAAPR